MKKRESRENQGALFFFLFCSALVVPRVSGEEGQAPPSAFIHLPNKRAALLWCLGEPTKPSDTLLLVSAGLSSTRIQLRRGL